MYNVKKILTSALLPSLAILIVIPITCLGQDPSGRPPEGPSRNPKRTPKRTPPKPDPGPITVILTVLSDPPDSAVFLNGEPRGATNGEGKIQLDKLPLGSYSVEVRKDGYKSMLRPFQAGSDSPTLVFKLEPNLEDAVKQFDALVASGKLAGPASPNAFDLTDGLTAKFPDRPEVVRMRSILSIKFVESAAPVIANTVTNWRAVARGDMVKAQSAVANAIALKKDDNRSQAQASYLRGVLALRDWQTGGNSPRGAEGAGNRPPASAPAAGGLGPARAEFENALRFDDSFAAARLQLGIVFFYSGDLSPAEAAFSKVTQIEPRWSPAFTWLGMTYYAQSRYKEAIDTYRKAIEIDPRRSAAVAGLGLARVAKGEKDGLKDIERAIQLDPSSALPRLDRGLAFAQSKNKKEKAQAADEIEKAIQMNADNLEFPNQSVAQVLADLQKRKK